MISFSEMIYAMTIFAVIGCAVVAGIFFAFSTFIMKALARIPAEAGITAMQTINVTVLGPWFLGVFFGSGAICAVILIQTLFAWRGNSAIYLFTGSLLYLVGSILVTIVFNVPKNKRLAVLMPSAEDAESEWRDYVSRWTFWNHVRTAASAAAALCFSLALGAGV